MDVKKSVVSNSLDAVIAGGIGVSVSERLYAGYFRNMFS